LKTHIGLGPVVPPKAEPAPERPAATKEASGTAPDGAEGRSVAAVAKSAVESKLPATGRETPAARAAAEGKVIPFPARKEDELAPEPAPVPPRPEVHPPSEVKPTVREPVVARRAEAPAEALGSPLAADPPAAESNPDSLPGSSRGKRGPASSHDDWHEDFFSAGDEGRYEGGPAGTLEERHDIDAPPPDSEHHYHDAEDDHLQAGLSRSPEQEARRTRFMKIVAGVIGFGLAVFAVAIWQSRSAAPDETPAPVPAPQPRAAAPEPPPVAPTPEPAAEPTPQEPAEPPAAAVPEPPPAPPEAPAASKPAPAPKPPAPKRPPAVAAQPQAAPEKAAPPPAPPEPAEPAEPGRPPTASFPID
jgi:hypothetical protein